MEEITSGAALCDSFAYATCPGGYAKEKLLVVSEWVFEIGHWDN